MNQPTKYRDYPIEECAKEVHRLRKENPQINAYQKFTCENCGQRLTMPEANIFFTSGTCDQCGHETNIDKNGCNYSLHFIA